MTKKDIGNNLKKFQEERRLKATDIFDRLHVSKSTYYKYISEGIDSYEFITQFAETFKYDLVRGEEIVDGDYGITKQNNEDIEKIAERLKCDNNFIIYDNSYALLNRFGEELKSNGYNVYVFNLFDTSRTCRYNPLQGYCIDIEYIFNTLSKRYSMTEEPYSKILFQIVYSYLSFKKDSKYKRFSVMLKTLQDAELKEKIRKYLKDYKENNDYTISNLEETILAETKNVTLKDCYDFLNCSDDIWKKATEYCIKILGDFNKKELANLTKTNDFDIYYITDKTKRILFCISNPTNKYEFLNEIMAQKISQIVEERYSPYSKKKIDIINPPENIKEIYRKNPYIDIESNNDFITRNFKKIDDIDREERIKEFIKRSKEEDIEKFLVEIPNIVKTAEEKKKEALSEFQTTKKDIKKVFDLIDELDEMEIFIERYFNLSIRKMPSRYCYFLNRPVNDEEEDYRYKVEIPNEAIDTLIEIKKDRMKILDEIYCDYENEKSVNDFFANRKEEEEYCQLGHANKIDLLRQQAFYDKEKSKRGKKVEFLFRERDEIIKQIDELKPRGLFYYYEACIENNDNFEEDYMSDYEDDD